MCNVQQILYCYFSYSLGQNIFILFHFLAKLFFTTNDTVIDYYHHKVNVQVTSPVTERLKSGDLKKRGNFKNTPNKLEFDAKYPAGHPKAKTFFGKKLQNFSCKTFNRKTYFA